MAKIVYRVRMHFIINKKNGEKSNMKEYFLKPDAFMNIRKRLLITLLVKILTVVIIISIISLSLKDIMPFGLLYLFLIPVIIIYIVIDGNKISKTKKEWNSFKIALLEDSIVKSQIKTKEIKILFNEINKIAEISSGLAIQTVDNQKYLFIPKAIENYKEIKNELLNILPIELSPVNIASVPNEFTIKQHNRKRSIINKLLIRFTIYIGLFIIVVILISFLSTN